jgi:hypothetical protein
MCVFCDDRNLRLLSAPLEDLATGELAHAVRAAREAAHVGLLKHAEAALGHSDAEDELDPAAYADVVLNRAEEAGMLDGPAAFVWSERLATAAGLRDPRVQAFLACGAEVIDEYRLALPERQQIVARFVEIATTAVRFTRIGEDGELWFECGNETYAALRRHEALDVVERDVARELCVIPPAELLRYTQLPHAATDILASIQGRSEDEANAILAGLVDVPALAVDRVRSTGFAYFFKHANASSPDASEFGDWILLHEPR